MKVLAHTVLQRDENLMTLGLPPRYMLRTMLMRSCENIVANLCFAMDSEPDVDFRGTKALARFRKSRPCPNADTAHTT